MEHTIDDRMKALPDVQLSTEILLTKDRSKKGDPTMTHQATPSATRYFVALNSAAKDAAVSWTREADVVDDDEDEVENRSWFLLRPIFRQPNEDRVGVNDG